jgi:hypothetical protein
VRSGIAEFLREGAHTRSTFQLAGLCSRTRLGWEFAVPVDTSVFIVYRDVESDVELDDAVRALRERVGGLQYVREVDSPLR